jgi:hypothetical protein
MMRSIAVAATGLALGLVGCAGVDIVPITREQAMSAHEGGSDARGYIVYEPVVMVEVSPREVCSGRDDKGKCITRTQCVAGEPFILPDYGKPYLINARAGLGKTGFDMTIADGWRLGGLKDASDNTAFLGALEKLATREPTSGTPAALDAGCKAAGLYRVSVGQDGVALTRVLLY